MHDCRRTQPAPTRPSTALTRTSSSPLAGRVPRHFVRRRGQERPPLAAPNRDPRGPPGRRSGAARQGQGGRERGRGRSRLLERRRCRVRPPFLSFPVPCSRREADDPLSRAQGLHPRLPPRVRPVHARVDAGRTVRRHPLGPPLGRGQHALPAATRQVAHEAARGAPHAHRVPAARRRGRLHRPVLQARRRRREELVPARRDHQPARALPVRRLSLIQASSTVPRGTCS